MSCLRLFQVQDPHGPTLLHTRTQQRPTLLTTHSTALCATSLLVAARPNSLTASTKSSAKPPSSNSIPPCRPSRRVHQICRVATCVRGEGRDHGGLGPGREGEETLTLFGPVVLGEALTRKSSGASREQQNTRERGKGREGERERDQASSILIYSYVQRSLQRGLEPA